MAVQRFKISLNNARFPMVSKWAPRAVLIPSIDVSVRGSVAFAGDEENLDFNVPQILYGENFVPVVNGVKSVSYKQMIAPTVNVDFDQVFPLRDSEENTVLFSPGGGKNYVYDKTAGAWTSDELTAKWAAEAPPLYIAGTSEHTPATAAVTRAYVEGKTVVCYSRLGLSTTVGGAISKEGSLYAWDEVNSALARLDPQDAIGVYRNLPIPKGEIDGVSASNGYLIFWSGLTVYWAPFNGTAFDFQVYANGEVTGAGSSIAEDIQGPIQAIVPMSGGFIIFTNKNAVAAFYNANNFASPWIFRNISGAGGVESFEQVSTEGGVGTSYAYTSGGLQKFSLNTAEAVFADVTDFLGGKYIEHFNTGNLTLTSGEVTVPLYTKMSYCSQRFLVISYGMMPGIYSYALVYDAGLKRWGKLRLEHRDCFTYEHGAVTENVTYGMLLDVNYTETDPEEYDDYTVTSGPLTYPRQSVAFLLKTGEVKLAVLDNAVPEDDSEAFVIIGRNQLSRSKLTTLLSAEIDGLQPNGQVAVWRSVDGRTLDTALEGVLRQQTLDFAEYGFDMPTGKNFTLFVKGAFHLSDVILEANADAMVV
jgi:hypothetical protein